jgi:hypothetical protein
MKNKFSASDISNSQRMRGPPSVLGNIGIFAPRFTNRFQDYRPRWALASGLSTCLAALLQAPQRSFLMSDFPG